MWATRRCLILIAMAVFAPSYAANGGELTFSGAIELVSGHTLIVRLVDHRLIISRLPQSGALSGNAIAATYRIGDQVEITAGRWRLYSIRL